MPRARVEELPDGIERTVRGYRASVWVPWPGYPKGRVLTKRFTRTATYEPTFAEMAHWRQDQRVDARRRRPELATPAGAGFLADADRYLEAVQAMPSFKDRVRDIRVWADLFGERPRAEIAAAEIRTARDRWLTVGPKRVMVKPKGQPAKWIEKPIPLSASAVNHRLRALENLYTVLDGKHAPNPVREVQEAAEPDPQPRGHSFALALEILSCMPDRTTPKAKGTWERGSLSRVRFEAMLWTGLPAVQLARLKPELVDWFAPAVLVPRRHKGRTSRRARGRRAERPRPLLPQAADALKRFFALHANRAFSSTSLAQSVRRAIKAANKARAAKRLPLIPERLRVYDLTRHTFGTEAARASKGNMKAVQELMGHSDSSMTDRYAMAAVTEQTVLAIQQLEQHARAQQAPRRGGKVSGKVSPPLGARFVRTGRTPQRKTLNK